ncbi:MAG: hypothetical protein AAGH65_05075, partial [Pseudomonadota bacterium]
MTALIVAARRGLADIHRWSRQAIGWRAMLPGLLLALAVAFPEAGHIMVATISDAYLAVRGLV